jgi:glycosyltransferase involved in cell wall biosynthesis
MTIMRICHITTVHPAKDARIFYRMGYTLAERGCPVTLIAPEPAIDSLVRMSPWNPRLAQARRIQRIMLALRAALSENADIYHFHDPELIPLGLALKVWSSSAVVVYDVHEDYPAMMRVKHWLPQQLRPLLGWAAQAANIGAGLCLDGIVTADPSVQKDFQHIAAHKTFVYYNFPTLSVFDQGQGKLFGPKADLVYIGGMSARSGIFVLLDALCILAKQGYRPTVRLAGYTDGAEGLGAIQEGIRLRKLEMQVELCGRIPHSEVPSWLRSGRIGLVMLQPIDKFLKNIPSKMFEYWACGLPVIASDLPPIRQFLFPEKNGLLFDPSSAQDLAQTIRSLLERPVEREGMGRYGQKQVYDEWNNDRQIDSLIQFYEQIAKKKY